MPAMNLDVTEGQTFAAWRGLEAVTRSRADNATEREQAVLGAMQILEAILAELGFTIVDRQLTPVEAGEEEMVRGGRIGTLPAKPGIDNELPPEGEVQSAKKAPPPSHKPEERKHDERKHEEEHPKRR